MGMVEPDNIETLGSRRANGCQMVARIEVETCGTVGHVAPTNGAPNLSRPADEHSAAFAGRRLPCVSHHGIEGGLIDRH